LKPGGADPQFGCRAAVSKLQCDAEDGSPARDLTLTEEAYFMGCLGNHARFHRCLTNTVFYFIIRSCIPI